MAYNLPAYQYAAYPANSYQQQYSQAVSPQYAQAQTSYASQQQPIGIVWVDGEVGAKAYQLPAGWPVNAPMPLWDTNDTVIYLKSTNQMGMPNPLQKVHYTMEDAPAKQQSFAAPALPDRDMSIYATKDDLERMKEDLKHAITSMQGTKGANSNGKSSF